MKKIWIIAPFSGIEVVGTRNRFQYIANMLHKLGSDVILFTSDFSHRRKMHISKNIAEQYPYKVQIVHEPGYKKNVSIKRVISHIKFSNNLRKLIKRMEKPDLIYMAYPTMSAAYVSGKYAERNSIPFIIDVQDIWPESISSAINTEKIIVKILMWPFTKFANKIYKKADIIFGVSKTYVERANISGTKCKEFIPVYIGSELEKFDNVKHNKDGIYKKKGDIWITYIGTLSHSYDIDTAIKAFAELKKYKNIKLNILGAGPDEDKLKKLAKKLNVYNKNVYFYGYLKYEKMVTFLKKSDIALNAIKGKAKQTITNKLGDYLSAGLPILNSCQQIEVVELINKNKLGINYCPGKISSLKNAIIEMIEDNEKLKDYSKNSRLFAEKYFDRKESYKVIVNKIRECINER